MNLTDHSDAAFPMPEARPTMAEKVLNAATEKARAFKSPSITFAHLFAAIIETNPIDLLIALEPRHKMTTLMSMTESDISHHAQKYGPPGPGDIPLAPSAEKAIDLAIVGTAQRYTGDDLYGLELLYAMLTAEEPPAAEKSDMVDFFRAFLTHFPDRDITATRDRIDRYAGEIGQKRLAAKPPELGAARPG